MEKVKILSVGFLIIILGIMMIYFASTQPKSNLFSVKANSYMAGIGFIIMGIIYILNEL